MPDNLVRALVAGPAVPTTLTINRDQGLWTLRLWYHGHTMAEALNPVLLAELVLPGDQVPINARWEDLWRAVALKVLDLADGTGVTISAE